MRRRIFSNSSGKFSNPSKRPFKGKGDLRDQDGSDGGHGLLNLDRQGVAHRGPPLLWRIR